MMRTVDLVIAGDGRAARMAAAGALRRGQRVLLVLGAADGRDARRLRRDLRKAGSGSAGQLRIITSAEVVCVDGIDTVEAVVVRYARTGRLWAVNASGFLSFDDPSQSPHCVQRAPMRTGWESGGVRHRAKRG